MLTGVLTSCSNLYDSTNSIITFVFFHCNHTTHPILLYCILNSYQNGELDTEEDAGVSLEMATKFTLEERIPLLFIHGMIHLLGYVIFNNCNSSIAFFIQVQVNTNNS